MRRLRPVDPAWVLVACALSAACSGSPATATHAVAPQSTPPIVEAPPKPTPGSPPSPPSIVEAPQPPTPVSSGPQSAPSASPASLQSSPLALNDAELGKLAKFGFVISDRRHFPSFAEGWLAIYRADLPLYVSADAILHALHRSYDAILKDIETSVLIDRLDALLAGMRAHLAASEGASLSPQERSDADLFTGVALSLLRGTPPAPVAGASADEMVTWVDRATAAQGHDVMRLFGSARDVDFSQFTPRGHYAAPDQGAPPSLGKLARYFRAVMWLGRIDGRIVVPGPSGTLVLQRRELELACSARALMGPREMATWQALESTMNTFVGPRDAMGPADVDRFYGDLRIGGLRELASVPSGKVLETLVRGDYGLQRIASDLLYGDASHPQPLPRSFSFTGQRYIVDSHVLSDVVFDRVTPAAGKPPRMMPSVLDVAFAVLKNDEARALLAPEVEKYGYGEALEKVRARVDAGGESFWDSSLYNLWLGALRALSPGAASSLPPVATTEAWNRRMLNAQLASWAELRHDTILYAKQSYTGGIMCSFPDAYVDPYPAFYDRLAALADRGQAFVDALDFGTASRVHDRARAFFAQLGRVARTLERMAERQARGERPTAEQLEFINHAITEDPPRFGGCGPAPRIVHGWYVDLFYDGTVLPFDPTIADVHTQWTDEAGNEVGRVLHVGTGAPRLMAVRIDAARSFVGIVSDYSEVVTEHFQRLTDQVWTGAVIRQNPPDVPWMRDLVVR